MKNMKYNIDENKPILLIGTFKNDAILNEIYLARRDVIQRNLTSSPNNWESIVKSIKHNNGNDYSGIMINITETILLIACNKKYEALFYKLIDLIRDKRHLVFMYNDTITKKFNIFKKGYYKRYLFYDLFYSNRKVYNNLTNEYSRFVLNIAESKWYDENKQIKKEMIDDRFSDGYSDDSPPIRYFPQEEWKLFLNYLEKHTIDESQIFFDEENNEIKFTTIIEETLKKMEELVEYITAAGLNFIPYKYNIEIVNSIREYFFNENQSTVYKQYIFKDHIWASEFEKLLVLFQEYISKVKQIEIYFTEIKTDKGTVYTITSKNDALDKSSFSQAISDFSEFLNVCEFDIVSAKNILSFSNLTEKEIDGLVQKYYKEVKRLKTDIRQSYERRMLDLKHSLENDAIEKETYKVLSDFQRELKTGNYPVPVILNINKIDTFNSIAAKTIYGDIAYNEFDKQLLDLFKAKQDENDELKNELLILKDEKIDNSTKNQAWLKIKKFLAQNAPKIGNIGYNLLQKYLESLIFGS